MPTSKYKIVKDNWGSRTNFQAAYGLGMTPDDLKEGDNILEAFQRNDASRSQEDDEREIESDWVKTNRERQEAGRPSAPMEPESDWVKGNRERYEARGRSLLKEYAARQVANKYGFTQTGDPENDLIIAMGLEGMMEDDPESSDMFSSREPAGSSGDTGGADMAPEGKKTKRQKKLEAQRESARRFNAQRPPG